MNRRWKGALAGLAAAFALTMPASLAAEVVVNGAVLSEAQAWIEDGTSYITLRSFAELTGGQLTWDGRAARLTGEDLDLTARPGQLYITVNGRALYVKGGVQVEEGRLVLPVGVLSQATGSRLTWNAAEGAAHLDTRQADPADADYDENDLYWLARIISAESRGEPLLGQIAVGNVVLNRVRSRQFPNTVRDVVFDRNHGTQFEPVDNGTVYDPPTESAVVAAKLCLEGANVVGDCLYFYAPALSSGKWVTANRPYYTTIGCHRFYL